MVDCTVWLETTSVDCGNFTLYKTSCDGYCWKSIWLSCSVVTIVVLIILMCQKFSPDLQPKQRNLVLKCLLTKPYFWSLNLTLVLVMIYDSLIIYKNHNAKPLVELLVMLWKLATLILIYKLNFTLPPAVSRGYSYVTLFAYYISLVLFTLDNFSKFVATSAQVAFKFHTIYRDNRVKAWNIIDLMLMAVNGLLYHSFMTFFWNKMFLGEKDILLVYRQDFESSLDKETSRLRNAEDVILAR